MTLLYFILILGVIVFIHELGHFIFAKKSGIYVYEFSIGMGPRILKWNRKNDETDYCLRLFPIGGFVQMAGEEIDDDKSIPKDKKFSVKTFGQKFMTVIAGIMMNFILAIVLLFIVGLINGAPQNKTTIGVVDPDYPAYTAGLEVGDEILKVNGRNANTNDKLTLQLQVFQGEPITFEVNRDGQIKDITVTPIEETENGEVVYKYGIQVQDDVEHGVFGEQPADVAHVVVGGGQVLAGRGEEHEVVAEVVHGRVDVAAAAHVFRQRLGHDGEGLLFAGGKFHGDVGGDAFIETDDRNGVARAFGEGVHDVFTGVALAVKGHGGGGGLFALEEDERAEGVDEVGVDATRFWMIMRSSDTTIDFDIDLAKSQSDKNPVFYVQYAHARACSILRKAVENRFDTENKKELEPLFTQSEIDILDKNSNIEVLFEDKNDKDSVESAKALILKLEESKAIIEAAVRLRAPYLLCKYSQELATAFHHFYNYSRVLTDDKEISAQRLALTKCFKIILGKMLNLLGVSAPEKM